MLEELADAMEYTGHESNPSQPVKVWQLRPGLGTFGDVIWFQTLESAFQWIEDKVDEIVLNLSVEVQVNGGERGCNTISLERVKTTAQEAAARIER